MVERGDVAMRMFVESAGALTHSSLQPSIKSPSDEALPLIISH